MPIDPSTITVSDLVRRAAAIVDADGLDEAVTEFATRYEDDEDPDEILKLAARSEFDAKPPEPVREWLERNGIEL